MPLLDIEEIIKELRDEAAGECECSEKQLTGEDSTVCKSCEAAHIINMVGELLIDELKERIKKDRKC